MEEALTFLFYKYFFLYHHAFSQYIFVRMSSPYMKIGNDDEVINAVVTKEIISKLDYVYSC